MRFKTGLGILFLTLLCACNTAQDVPYNELRTLGDEQTAHFFYPSSGGTVEAYLSRPRGIGPFPLVLLLHGHSFVGRGAGQVLSTAKAFTNEGCFASLAISLPGYGSTRVTGGTIEQTTRQVVKDGLSAVEQLSWIDKTHIALFGVSRGAVAAAAVSKEVEGLSGMVLYSGAYDLGRLYRETSNYWLRRMLNPNGDENPKLLSLLPEASKWHAPTLILHGEQDMVIPVNQSLLLRDQLKAAGVPYRLVLYPHNGHFLPRASVREESINFLKEIAPSSCAAASAS